MEKNRYILIGLVVGVLAFLVFGTITALIPTGFFSRMFKPEPLDYIFLSLTSILLGAYVSLHLYGKEKSSKKEECALVGGTIAGVFSFSCPLCNVILVSLFGVAFVSTYLKPAGSVLGVIGVLVLSAAVYMKVRDIRNTSSTL